MVLLLQVPKGGITVTGPCGRSLYAYRCSKGRLMLRPWSNTSSHKGQPMRVAFRILMELLWGPPPSRSHIACHVACDHEMCMNPAHGRWGTQGDNRTEAKLLKKYYAALGEVPTHLRGPFKRACHPCRGVLYAQGFWARRRMF